MALQTTTTSSLGPRINVTPLIDVLLVLLIIFMVISPLKPNQFTVKAPEKAPATDEINPLALVVTLDSGGGLRLNASPATTLNELEDLLHRALDGRPLDLKTTFIKAPQGVRYAEVIRVIDVMKAAGCAPIGLQIEELD
jgi:biopolymer transport protein TolR